jgi:hypothetical protein
MKKSEAIQIIKNITDNPDFERDQLPELILNAIESAGFKPPSKKISVVPTFVLQNGFVVNQADSAIIIEDGWDKE